MDNPSEPYEFSTVIQRYRDYRRDTKHRSKPRGTHGAFGATENAAPRFQDRTASDNSGNQDQSKGQTQNKREPPKCRFHDENHFWSDCPYLNKAVRTADWIADKEIMAKVQKKLQEDKLFKAKVEVAIAKRAAYQARTTTKPKPQSKSKGKKGPIAAENTPESIYTIQELSDNKEESEPEHVFTTTMVWSVSEEPQPKVLEIRDSTILDSSITIHIVNDYICLTNFRPAKPSDVLLAGTSSIQIEGFGDTEIWAQCPTKSRGIRRVCLGNCALVSGFHTNLVLLYRFIDRGVY